jgi:hypothetical protein
MRKVALSASLLGILLYSAVASADPLPSEKAMAQTLFGEGRALMTAGKMAEACVKLAESDRLDPEIGTHLNLGLCHEALGQTATAWVELSEVADRASLAHDAERATFARQRAQDLDRKLSRVRLRVVAPAPGMILKLDGRPVGQAAWGEPLPLDPGPHPVEATAPGKRAWAQQIEVRPGPVVLDVAVPALADAGDAPAPASTAVPSPPGPVASRSPPAAGEPVATPALLPPPSGESGGGSAGRTAGLVIGGVGLAGVVVGSVFGAMTFAKNGTAKNDCNFPDGGCSSAGVSAGKDASTFATVSDVAFGVGLAAVAAGAILFVTSRHAAAPSAVRVLPVTVGSSGGGLLVRGSW